MMTMDAVFLPVCLWFSYVLRLSDFWPGYFIEPLWWIFPFVSIFGVLIFAQHKIYQSILRYINQDALAQILRSILILSLCLMILGFYAAEPAMPRSIPFIFAFVCTAYVTATRYLYRNYHQWVLTKLLNKGSVAIYGAGSAGVQLATALKNSKEYKAVAFIDDNRNLRGSFVAGLKVYHPDELKDVVTAFDIKHVLLAIPSAPLAIKNKIINKLISANIHILTIPSIAEMIMGNANIDTLSTVPIQNLLGREAVIADDTLIKQSIFDKIVLVSGAGGSIGSELCRQVVQSRPKKIILFEINEFALYQIERELRETADPACDIIAILGNICDEGHLDSLISNHCVQTIYHAAAYKHVPLVEQNPMVAIKNNVLGTKVLCDCARKHNVERFILISSDKAVRSTSIMGATKRMSELIVQDNAQHLGKITDRASPQTIFSMVRFGNVLGSSGSVEPLFRKQIREGGPVTVTDPNVTRYFMTIPEASSLVIQAGSMAIGGEVFILEMGQKVKIIDLARRMIHLSGFTIKDDKNPAGDIEIKITGLRPGEKMTEELMIGTRSQKTQHPHIFKVFEEIPTSEALHQKLETLEKGIKNYQDSLVVEAISGALTGYNCGTSSKN